MKQLLLAAALIALPVAAFSAFNIYLAGATVSAATPAAGLGDMTVFTIIIADVQTIVATGDLAAAKVRIADFETAWGVAEGLNENSADGKAYNNALDDLAGKCS